MSKINDLENPFNRADRIRLIESEISFNANSVNNVSVVMSVEDRLNNYCSIETTMEWYSNEINKLKIELMERINVLDMEYITFNQTS